MQKPELLHHGHAARCNLECVFINPGLTVFKLQRPVGQFHLSVEFASAQKVSAPEKEHALAVIMNEAAAHCEALRFKPGQIIDENIRDARLEVKSLRNSSQTIYRVAVNGDAAEWSMNSGLVLGKNQETLADILHETLRLSQALMLGACNPA